MLGQWSCDPKVLYKLLEYGPDLTIRDKEGNGPLHLLLKQSRPEALTLKALLDAGADPDERNKKGQTPLLTMRFQSPQTFENLDILLAAGADINARDVNGATILSTASPDEINSLIAKGSNIGVRDYRGRTLLHRTVSNCEGLGQYTSSKASRFDFFLGLGIDPKAVDFMHNTLMHDLASYENILESYSGSKLVPRWKQLVKLGLSPDQANNEGRTTLHMIAASQPCTHGGAYTSNAGSVNLADLVIAEAKNLNPRDNRGLTPLHLAATVSELVVKKLLDAGASPTATTFEGLTPLHLAARARQSNIVGLLLEQLESQRMESIDACDENGHTALYYACRSGSK
jgi:ankyrin repeat protein